MQITIAREKWPLREAFTISRDSKSEAEVVVVTVQSGDFKGFGECVPYKRYNETFESVEAQLLKVSDLHEHELSRVSLAQVLPPGAARNALDCALWDLEAKQQGKTIWHLLSFDTSLPKQTSFTISLDTPETMAHKAAIAAQKHSLLKIKLGGNNDEDCILKIREFAPNTRLIVDANEGWSSKNLARMIKACELAKVELIEQPLPAKDDAELLNIKTPILICADESFHTAEDFDKISGKYTAINIKLDKTGGLTEALEIVRRAQELDISIMIGCMVSTSLSMAPATVLAQYAQYVDLDGPLLLAADRKNSLQYSDSMVHPTNSNIWG
jgi:L-Ala-D/L-Glu epimerase